jgi:predicted P-loop ATPase
MKKKLNLVAPSSTPIETTRGVYEHDNPDGQFGYDPETPLVHQKLMRTEEGALRQCFWNAVLLIGRGEKLRGMFSFDQMQGKIIVNGRLPGPSEVLEGAAFDPDKHLSPTRLWLQSKGLYAIGKEDTFQAILTHARRNEFHPLQDYLHKVVWDGQSRIDNWLHVHLGAPDGEYTRFVGRKFLISMVARVLHPGCKADHMMILEGGQGTRKSAALRILAGEKYFSDSMPHLRGVGDKEAQQHLQGKWLVEIAELDAFSKGETRAIKGFLSKQADDYRPPYGRASQSHPRVAVFAGTTNEDQYLEDPTGGRRFWPVETGEINLSTLAENRDQLFAEAVTELKAGATWWPENDHETELARAEQGKREKEPDAWTDRIVEWLRSALNDAKGQGVSTADALDDAILMPRERQNRAAQMRVAAIFRRLGLERLADTSSRRWVLPAGAELPERRLKEAGRGFWPSAGAR